MLNSLRSCSIPAAAGEWGRGSRPSPSPLRGSPRLPARVGGLCSGRPGGGSSAFGLASPGRRVGLVLVPSLRGAAALLRTSGPAPGGAWPFGAAAPRRGWGSFVGPAPASRWRAPPGRFAAGVRLPPGRLCAVSVARAGARVPRPLVARWGAGGARSGPAAALWCLRRSCLVPAPPRSLRAFSYRARIEGGLSSRCGSRVLLRCWSLRCWGCCRCCGCGKTAQGAALPLNPLRSQRRVPRRCGARCCLPCAYSFAFGA